MSTKAKIINTQQLAATIRETSDYGLNRQLDFGVIKKLDKEGFHVVSVVLPYHNGRDQETPHHRCSVLIKFKGKDEPVEVIFDIAESTYETFTDAVTVMDRIAKMSQEIVKDAVNVG